MKIYRTSPVTGEINVMDLDITNEQIIAYEKGALAQDVFTNLNDDELEFFISGCTVEDFEFLFPNDEEDEYDFDDDEPAF